MYRSSTVYATTRRALSLQPCSRVLLSAATCTVPSRTSATVAQTARALPDSYDESLKPFSAIPGPKPLPVFRNLLDFKRNSERTNEYLGECYQKYGEIYKLSTPGGNNFVVMADPNQLETVLRAEGKYPRRETLLSPNMAWLMTKLNYPVSLAFESGEAWKKARRAVSQQIKPSNVQTYSPGLNGVASRFTEHLKSVRDENNRISDVSRPLRRLLVEMSAKFVYNTDLDVFNNPNEETERFIDGVGLFFECIGKMSMELPLYKIFPNKLYRDAKKSLTILREFGLIHANEALARIEAGEENEVQGLLEQWLRAGKISQAEALMTSTDMFGAGVDTTSNQAAFMLYHMAHNPEAQEQLYEEIKSVMGDRTEPTPEDLSKMPYLKGCMLESFRTQSTAELIPRVLSEDLSMMGYHIPAETNIWYLTFIASKDEKLFPNPEKFDPERWARDKPNPFAVLPFGFGPRGCYGRRFAELELKLILFQMTREFVLETDRETMEVEYAAIVRPAGDVPLYLKDRRN